jgi:hypothetical protein
MYQILIQPAIFIIYRIKSLNPCASSWVGYDFGCGCAFCPYPSFYGLCCAYDLCFSYDCPSTSNDPYSSWNSVLFSYPYVVSRFGLYRDSYRCLEICPSLIVLSHAIAVLFRVPAVTFTVISPVIIALSLIFCDAAAL